VKKLIPATVTFNAHGLPVATEFDDIYFANADGLAESRYVFLQHNDLSTRWQQHPTQPFVIAESGFGTGLNLLATWQLLRQQQQPDLRLHYISFEKHPLQRQDLARALHAFPELAELAAELLAAYPAAAPGCQRCLLDGGRIVLDLWFGDILELLPQWLPTAGATVNAWYLDGFAPDKNPAMWQPQLFAAMAQSAAADCTFATFTAAGSVRRGLQQAGFVVHKHKGFGAKREMLAGRIEAAPTAVTADKVTHVTIIGGGIAAACAAHALQRQGIAVEVISSGIADGASGNAQGAVYPLLQGELSPTSEFFLAAFCYAQQFYRCYLPELWRPVGVLQLAYNQQRELRQAKITGPAAAGHYSSDTVAYWSAAQTQAHWHGLPALPSLYYPTAGWLPPRQAVPALLKSLTLQSARLTAFEPCTGGWQLTFSDGSQRQCATLLLACGGQLTELLEPFGVQLQNVRGQVSYVKANTVSASCPSVICYKGYFTPAHADQHCVGATYARQFDAASALQPRPTDDQDNLAVLADNLQQPSWAQQLQVVASRAALRNTTRDHLPIAGQLAQQLWVIGGLGSRGFTSAPLVAELIAAELAQQPLPLGADLRARLLPQRLITS
jgi:tRNA 5-methylaminomethyl-2-thiouridine biosynthesis bifunctional protein